MMFVSKNAKKLFVLMVCMLAAAGVQADPKYANTFGNGSSYKVENGTLYIDIAKEGDLTSAGKDSEFSSAASSCTTVKFTGTPSQDDVSKCGQYPLQGNIKRVDLSEATTSASTVAGQISALILPNGATVPEDVKKCQGGTWGDTVNYGIALSSDGSSSATVSRKENDTSWKSDPILSSVDVIFLKGNFTEADKTSLESDFPGKTILMDGEDMPGFTTSDLTIDANTENVKTTIDDFVSETQKIGKLTITGELSDITTVLSGVECKSVDLSGLTNSSITGLVLPTTTGEIKLPGGITYSNGTVTTESTTTYDQLNEAMAVLAANGKSNSITSVTLPGGSTYQNGTLTLTAADESNLPAIKTALSNGNLSISTINFASGSTYQNGRLTTVAANGNEAAELSTKATLLRNAGLAPSTVVLSDKTTWENNVMTTKQTGDAQDADKAMLNAAGFTVSSVVESSVSGDYVTEAGGITTLTLPAGESLSTAFQNMTQEEKDALKTATNLKLIGSYDSFEPFRDNEVAHVEKLDLSDAIISSSALLSSNTKWQTTLEEVILPKDPNYTTIPTKFAYQLSELKTVVFSNNITTISSQAFLESGLEVITLPSSITSVGEEAFLRCDKLDKVVMQELTGTCEFGNSAFKSCSNLKHVTLAEGVPYLSENMFDACGQLESIRIPTTCKTIKTKAFNCCASLHTLIIPEGVELIEAGAFAQSGLTDVYVMATSIDKVPKIYSSDKDTGSDGGTFTKGQLNGQGRNPKDDNKHTDEEIRNATDEEILSWYQEEQSNPNYGVGGGQCLIQLHYPESMRYFYDGVNNPLTNSLDWYTEGESLDRLPDALFKKKKEACTEYLSQAYSVGGPEAGINGQYYKFGPQIVDGKEYYWPTSSDCMFRLAAGYAEGASVLGWRQFPLQKVASVDDYIFSKDYDDTWYTMCFPWDMEDNQLFDAFNQNCEITEFVGVEVTKADNPATENVIEYSLVFHFDKVAGTYYMTQNHLTDGLRYVRDPEASTTRTETIQVGESTIKKKYYTYKLVEGSDPGYETVYWPTGLPDKVTDRTAEQKAMCDRYQAILHLMVFAGHPYMIHPSIGASPGTPSTCTFAGVKKLVKNTQAEYDKLAADSAVYKTVTTDGKAYHKPGAEPFLNPETGKGGKYYFIGNIRDKVTDVEGTVTDTGAKNMLEQSNPAYYLGVAPGSYYPKYYRKTSGGIGKWSQYSAIICPDADALAHVEGLDGMTVTKGGSAKQFDVAFGEWQIVTPTAIKEIIADAEKNEQPVKQVHLNVVFNINGQVVRQGTSVEGLPKGLYIVNGKKYMVK